MGCKLYNIWVVCITIFEKNYIKNSLYIYIYIYSAYKIHQTGYTVPGYTIFQKPWFQHTI